MENQYPTISKSFENMGTDIRQNMPRLIIGEQNNPKTPVIPGKEPDIIDKIRNWALIFFLVLVLGYAIYRFWGIFF